MFKLPAKTRPVKGGTQIFEQGINPNAVAPFDIGIQPNPEFDPIGQLHEKLDLQARAKEAKARLQRRKPGEPSPAKNPPPSAPSPASSSAASGVSVLGSKKGKPKPKPKPTPQYAPAPPAKKGLPRTSPPRVATPLVSAAPRKGGAPPRPVNDPVPDELDQDYPIPPAYDEPATPEEAAEAFADLPDGEVVDDRMLGLLQKVARHGLTPWKNSLPFGGFPRWPRLSDSARKGMVERFRALCTLDIVQHVASQLVQKSGALSNTVLARGTATSLAWLAWHALDYDLDFKPREVLPG